MGSPAKGGGKTWVLVGVLVSCGVLALQGSFTSSVDGA